MFESRAQGLALTLPAAVFAAALFLAPVLLAVAVVLELMSLIATARPTPLSMDTP